MIATNISSSNCNAYEHNHDVNTLIACSSFMTKSFYAYLHDALTIVHNTHYDNIVESYSHNDVFHVEVEAADVASAINIFCELVKNDKGEYGIGYTGDDESWEVTHIIDGGECVEFNQG